MARPTTYTEELRDKAYRYIDTYEQEGDAVPSISGLSLYLGVNRTTLYSWAENHDEVNDILDTIKSLQERLLLTRGLEGHFNSNIVKLMLGKHGYSDKQDMNLNAEVHGKVDTEFNIVEPDGDS